jgi:para-aminobenzoate synthetase/4-amino-4-deoxychorismate lyase
LVYNVISILLETILPSRNESRNIWIDDPEIILETRTLSDVPKILKTVDQAVSDGSIAVGFLSYEAGYGFLPNMPRISVPDFPLAWFALNRTYEREVPQTFVGDDFASVDHLKLNTSAEEYKAAIDRIRKEIEMGYTYQVNFTIRYQGRLQGSSRALYRQLRSKQRVPYGAFIETPDWTVLSFSPELFFRSTGDRIVMRPMKGTSRRGRTLEEDAQWAAQLSASEKERAENRMIVDLLRNDLGKICEPGSIHVTNPLTVERYDTVLQMTSGIEGRLRTGIQLPDTMKALFPSGSVTGAPKIRTMQIIHDLEKSPRGIYTGCIGFHSKEETVFSVAIRTAVATNEQLEMGVGSGILYEADAEREYDECTLKGRFLTDPPIEFQLLETILWLPESGYQRLELHMDRLMSSAEYFLIPLQRDEVVQFLTRNTPKAGEARRVRLLVNLNGQWTMNLTELETLPSSKIQWAQEVVNTENRFLYHKTTHRPVYEQELARARSEGCMEVIFQNERGAVTEGAFSNVWILKDGVYCTPPVACGLLAGTYRRYLLSNPDIPTQEKVLFQNDLEEADEIFISNAIRGLLKVELTI